MMTLNEIVDAAKAQAIESGKFYMTYRVPGHSNLSIYVIPTRGYLTSRKASLRVQFQIDFKRVSQEVFEAALAS